MIGVTVCVDYEDFFALTYPINRKHFREWIVVTRDARPLAPFEGITVREYPIDDWNKGWMMNAGLVRAYRKIMTDEPVCIVDADTAILGEMSRDCLPAIKDVLYGAPRHMLLAQRDYFYCLNDRGSLDPLLVKSFAKRVELVGYGYFQVFFDRVYYPENYRGASHSDKEFRGKFKRVENLPFLTVAHLGLPKVNWKGRVSPSWIRE